jgi:sortase A
LAPGTGAVPEEAWLKIRGGRRPHPVLVALSIACIAAGFAIAAQIGWFLRSSSVHGGALIHQERQAIAAATASRTACRGSAGGGGGARPRHGTPATPATPDRGAAPRGLLEAPALGLVAPVLEGTGDVVLNDAVGHVPASAWPGHAGTSVFAAHDVTWFSGIDRLDPGDEIRYVTPCRTYTYRVTSHRVVPAGYPVHNTAIPSIVLDTCYPLDALYLTSSRYLVYATLATTSPASASRPPQPSSAQPSSAQLTVPAPRALAAEGLALDQNDGPLGILRFSGSPSPAWRQTSAPLAAEAAALTAYFGVIRSAEQGQRAWWADLAPSVPLSAAAGLWHGDITGYDAQIDVVLHVRDDLALGAVLSTVLSTAGSAHPGTYDVTVTETVTGGGKLMVTGFAMRPPA